MRLARISLATKYRLLFGSAVVLIIGAALAVPWYYMESIVLMQPYREAQSVAANHFRRLGQGQHSMTAAGPHSGKFALVPETGGREPVFIPADPDPDAAQPPASQETREPFVVDAYRTLRKRPSSDFYWQTTWDETGRRFRYAHAVWVTRSCRDCHEEGRGARPYRENQLAGLIVLDLPAEQSRQASSINRVVIGAAGALAGILAILVFYVITTRFILAPIHELRRVALRVADGDLAVRSEIRSGDEFEQLSSNLNTMLERLRLSQEELRRANRLLDEKLEQMAEANVALYEANRIKSDFLANVSHELRTPLTSIIGFAELLREQPQGDGDPRTLRYAENILISGRILLEIINDLLDLAKIEAGRSELRLECLQVGGVCGMLLDHIRPLADRRKLQIELEAAEGVPPITSDPGKLRQILFNLLSNAVKFTPEGGQVWVRVEPTGAGGVEIAVRDTGPGIAPEHQQMIFEKFRQIDQSPTREHHGTGLGLAIARELTHLLGGEIGLISTPGQGATFWVRLPPTPPSPRERPRPSLV